MFLSSFINKFFFFYFHNNSTGLTEVLDKRLLLHQLWGKNCLAQFETSFILFELLNFPLNFILIAQSQRKL